MTSKAILVAVCIYLLALAPAAWGQDAPSSANTPSSQTTVTKPNLGIAGYLDPRTGTFTARPTPAVAGQPGAPPAGTTTILARLIFVFSILNDAPSGATTSCSVSISPQSTDFSEATYSEFGSATATSGGQSCTVTLLFSWNLKTPTTDTICPTYSISYGGGGASRESDSTLPCIAVPNNTQTITEPTFAVTI
jgi:hypothetical protein